MKSRTSFFNWAIVKKDITRFAPLWALYTAILMIVMLSTVNVTRSWTHPIRALDNSLSVLAFFNLVYGALSAQLLFGELFNSRLCNALHAMPTTRTTRFFSHICTGLAFSLIPNLLVSLLIMPALAKFWYLALFWMGAACLQYLFFFGIGVFSVMCTGNRFAMVLVYGMLNFMSYIITWFVSMVFLPNMPGVALEMELSRLFCPVVEIVDSADYFRASWNMSYEQTGGYPPALTDITFEGYGESWPYLLIIAAIGLAVLAAALLLYRQRKLESAGEFITVNWFRPIFLTLYTLCGGAFFAILGDLFGTLGISVLLIPGLIIGFFTGKMLLDRTIRVFRKKTFLQAGIFASVILSLLVAVKIDLFGIVRYVPPVENVQYVSVYTYGSREKDLYFPEEKELVHDLHSLAVEDICDGDCGAIRHRYVCITYHLRDGRTLQRVYHICSDEPAYLLLQKLVPI